MPTWSLNANTLAWSLTASTKRHLAKTRTIPNGCGQIRADHLHASGTTCRKDLVLTTCSMFTKTVAYHFENTLNSAIARNPRGPFSSLATVFWVNTWRKTFHTHGTATSSETLVKPASYLVHCLRRPALQHFCHKTIRRPIGLVLPSCPEDPVHRDRHPTPL